MSKIKIGQKVIICSRFSPPNEREVTNIGRKWAKLNDGRKFDKNTMQMEDYGGMVFLSYDDMFSYNKLHSDYDRIKAAVNNMPHDRDKIDKIAEILNIKL